MKSLFYDSRKYSYKNVDYSFEKCFICCIFVFIYNLFISRSVFFDAAKFSFQNFVFNFQEISTLDDEVVNFSDDRNTLVWFLQPQEAQFYVAAESLKYKPNASLRRTPLPFRPRISYKGKGKWPDLKTLARYRESCKESLNIPEGISGCYLI